MPRRIIFHDVDLVPCASLRRCYYTTQHQEIVHFGARFKRYSGSSYFGGVTAFTPRAFEQINGFPNRFWGWGGEDDALHKRVRKHRLCVHRQKYGSYTDLEHLHLREKLGVLARLQLKCDNKRELLREEPYDAHDGLHNAPHWEATEEDTYLVRFQATH